MKKLIKEVRHWLAVIVFHLSFRIMPNCKDKKSLALWMIKNWKK